MRIFALLCVMSGILVCLTPRDARTQNPTPTIQIISLIPSASGIDASLSVTFTRNMCVLIQTPDPNNGDYTVNYVRWMVLDAPPQQAAGAQPTTVNTSVPVFLPDGNKTYKVTFYAGPDYLSNGSSSSWVTTARTVHGFSPNITAAFGLKFNASNLTVSAKTGNSIATLGAQWQVGDSTTQAIKNEAQNPSVNLPYSDIGNTSALPIIKLTLENAQTHQLQEADLQISVNASDTQTKEAKQKANSTTDAQQKPKFTWGDFSKSVLGAILKYFAVA